MRAERVVPDTNILVSTLLNPFGVPARILDLVLAGALPVVHDSRILHKWRDVLRRERFGFAPTQVDALLSFLEHEGILVNSSVIASGLPDPDDAPFLEVAIAPVATLITGNLRHYPPERRLGAEVVSPHEFLAA